MSLDPNDKPWWGTTFSSGRSYSYICRDGAMAFEIGYGPDRLNHLIAAYDQHLADCGVNYKRRPWPVFPAEEE